MKRKKPKTIFDEIFGGPFSEIESLLDTSIGQGQTGYSIEITQKGDEKIIKVKTFGNVNKTALRSELQKQHPDAKIIFEGEKEEETYLIKEVREEEEKQKPEKKRETPLSFEKKSKPIIKEIKENS